MARYTDAELIIIIEKSARRVNRELSLFGTADEITVNASGDISPSDGTLEDLVLLQAECLAAQRDFIIDLSSGAGGVMARDGEQSIDTRQKLLSRRDFFDSDYSPCAIYKEQITLEKIKRSGDNGKLIW